jgi:multiple sugar transport system permease protein
MTKRARGFLGSAAVYSILSVAIVFVLFPLAWLVATSVKLPVDFYSSPPVWIPRDFTFGHYTRLFTTYGAAPFVRNSLIIALGNTALVLLIAVPAAYSMTRLKVGGHSFAFWILAQRMLPPVASAIPLFLLFARVGLLDTHISLILTYSIFNLAFAVWMLVGFFRDTPHEIYESAMLDGCTHLQIILRVIVPIIAPSIAVVGLFCFVFAWNELMFAITFTRSEAKTLMVLITSTMQSPTGIFFGEAAAGATIGILPPLFITVFFQRYLVRGLSMGAVKG